MLSKVYPLAAASKDASVRQPKELICFSRDSHNEFHIDDSQLSYYYFPDGQLNTPGGIQLDGGFNKFEKNPKEDVGELTGLLEAIETYERATNTKVPADIITWRGLMRQLMLLPYENRDKVVMNAVVFDGQIFIQTDIPTLRADREAEKQRQTELSLKQQFSGYKFETISTLPKPWAQCTRAQIEKRSKATVSNIEQYATVVRTSIGKTKLLLGAEVDCAFDYKPDKYNAEEGDDTDSLKHYAELKTTRLVDSPKSAAGFERKLLRTWSQCFLIGIPRVIYAFRDDHLILRSVEEFQTDQIPVIIRDAPFKPQTPAGQRPVNKCMHCLKFYSGLMAWLVETIPKDDESKTYRIEYDPINNKNYLNVSENCQEVTDTLLGEFNGADGGMLTTKFKEWRRERASS